MTNKNSMSKPYFSHDIASRGDIEIKKLIFRQGYEGYGIYWAVVEFLHENELREEDIPVLADDLHIQEEKLRAVLETDLFKTSDGKIYSERVNRNLKLQQEKAEKAKQSAKNRWYKKGDFIKSVIGEYEKVFGKELVLSNENKAQIVKLSEDNKITLSLWQKIFGNAHRGWIMQDGKKVIPTMQTIIEKWDAFASDDFYLAPDTRKKQIAEMEEKRKQEEEKNKEQAELEKAKREFENAKNQVCDKETAINFINTHCHIPNFMLEKSDIFRQYAKEYGITAEEVIKSRKGNEIEEEHQQEKSA